MARKPSPVMDPDDPSNWSFVVTWIARRFDQEQINLTSSFVISAPVAAGIDTGSPSAIDQAHVTVRDSWRKLQHEWARGWQKDYDGRLKNAEAYFTNLVTRTNDWIEQHFPSGDTGVGRERARLLAAVRQQRLREKRKNGRSAGIQVSISGDLYKALRHRHDIPRSKHHDFVRASLQIVLDMPELLVQVTKIAGVTM